MCGEKREIGRKMCRKCYLSHKSHQAKDKYLKFGRYKYTCICEACGETYTTTSKVSRICSSCWKFSSSFALPLNPYENAGGGNYSWKHRRIVETMLKRKLSFNEVIHHINENPTDNSLTNLLVISRKDHLKLHTLLRIERVIFEKSKNENPVNCWDTLRVQITTTWLETANVNVIKISEIGQSAAKPLNSEKNMRKVQRLTAQDTLTGKAEGKDIVQTTTCLMVRSTKVDVVRKSVALYGIEGSIPSPATIHFVSRIKSCQRSCRLIGIILKSTFVKLFGIKDAKPSTWKYRFESYQERQMLMLLLGV